MADPLITSEELQNRISPALWSMVFNDHNTGDENEPADYQLRADASSKVRATLGPNFPLEDLVANNPIYAEELRRLTLEVAHAMCAMRRPRLFPELDPFQLDEHATKQLIAIREGIMQLATDPEQGAGDAGAGDAAGGAVRTILTVRHKVGDRPIRFQENWGDF